MTRTHTGQEVRKPVSMKHDEQAAAHEDTMWVLRGAAPDDGNDDESTEDDQTEEDDDAQQDDDTSDADTDSNDDEDDEQDDDDVAELRTRLTEAEAEAARWKRRKTAADNRANAAEAEVRRLKKTEAPKPKDGDTPPEDDAASARIRELETKLQEQTLRDAFSGVTKYEWHNPRAAFRLLDTSDLRHGDDIDEDALADAVDELAKANPYLIKTTETPKVKAPARPTGAQPGAHKRDRSTPDAKALSGKYGALRNRI